MIKMNSFNSNLRNHFTLLLLLLFFGGQALANPASKTGEYDLETTTAEVLGNELANTYSNLLEVNEKIKWSIHVPKTYDPAKPPGIIVHMTERKNPVMPFGWSSTMEDKNLIWISLNKINDMITNKEMMLTIFSTALLEKNYSINLDRVYVVASSRACYPASAAAEVYPSIIKGVVYSTCDPINWRGDLPETIEAMKQNQFVFVSGADSELQRIMRRAVRRYKNAGISNTEYINSRKLAYARDMDRRNINKAIDLLDSR